MKSTTLKSRPLYTQIGQMKAELDFLKKRLELTWSLLIINRKDRTSFEVLQRLESCDGKLSCTVPRRAVAGNGGSLSGISNMKQ